MRFRRHKMIEAIYKAHEVNQEIIKFIDTDRSRVRQSRNTATSSCAVPEELFAAIKEIVPPEADGRGCIHR